MANTDDYKSPLFINPEMISEGAKEKFREAFERSFKAGTCSAKVKAGSVTAEAAGLDVTQLIEDYRRHLRSPSHRARAAMKFVGECVNAAMRFAFKAVLLAGMARWFGLI